MIKIEVNGQEYPCQMTMGALLRFKHETGKDVADLNDTSDVIILLWCCVASASNAHGIEFSMSLLDFADRLSPELLETFASGLSSPDDKKKVTGPSPT